MNPAKISDAETDTAIPAGAEGSGFPPQASGATYDGRDLEILATMKRYHRWIVDRFVPFLKGEAVEYGAGTGTFSRLILPYVTRLEIIEPSYALIGSLNREFIDESRVTVCHLTLEEHVATLADRSKDTLILINVLEHIEDDAAALSHFFRVLRPGGHLLLFVPALRWLFSDLDRHYGHFRRYHRRELTTMARDAGFEVATADYMDFFGIVPWWLLNTMAGRIEFQPSLVGLYDRIGVPFARFVENIITPPIGKNIAIVAIKC